MPTLEELKLMHEKQKDACKRLLPLMASPDDALELLSINIAANTFYECLMELIKERDNGSE